MLKSRTTNNESRITISEWLQKNTSALKEAKIESARLDATMLLEYVLKKPREWILAHNEYMLSGSEQVKLDKMLIQRLSHTPLAYIIGSKEFYGREFLVTENVLIPRPESETIIDLLRELVSGNIVPLEARSSKYNWTLIQTQDNKAVPTTNHQTPNTIIDVGTGSGCLAITAKLLSPDLHVTAIESSAEALNIAKKNAKRHGASIQFKQMDIADGLPAMPKTRPYVILANLPYVPENMITSKEITKEPKLALFSGKDGLDHYKMFWKQIAALKNKPVFIVTESLKDQHKALSRLADDSGYRISRSSDLAQLFSKI